MATESSLSNPVSGPKGGEIQRTTFKAKVVFVGAEYTGDDGAQRVMNLPLGLFVRHFSGPKYRVDIVVHNVLSPTLANHLEVAIGVASGVRGLFVFRDPSRSLPGYVAHVGCDIPVVVSLDAEKGLELLANLILQRVVGVVPALPSGG